MRKFATLLAVWPLACALATAFAPTGDVHAQTAALGNPAQAPSLLTTMAGDWRVTQRMRPAADAEFIALPAAVAHRRVIGGAYLEEVMEAAPPASAGDVFTRTAYLNYNAVERRYEYVSLDTRAPQQMRYATAHRGPDVTTAVKLAGGRFVAAQWGAARNVAFNYRIEVGPVVDDRQTVRLYLTPSAKPGAREFVAFEYDYARER